jgi:hypothetical protein
MFNPFKLIGNIANGYINFWEINSTTDRVFIHLQTIGLAAFAYRTFKGHLSDMVRVCELTALVAFAFHFIFSTMQGMRAKKEPDQKEFFNSLSIRIKVLEKKINYINKDILHVIEIIKLKQSDV